MSAKENFKKEHEIFRVMEIKSTVLARSACHAINKLADRFFNIEGIDDEIMHKLMKQAEELQDQILSCDIDIAEFEGPVKISKFKGFKPSFSTPELCLDCEDSDFFEPELGGVEGYYPY